MTGDVVNHKKFFAFEKKNNLFEKKHKDLFFWDIIRYDVYYDIVWNVKNTSQVTAERSPATLVLKDLFRFFISFVFTRYDYLFFTASRNRSEQGYFFDQNLEDYLRQYPNSVCYESFERDNKKRQNKRTVFNPAGFFRKIFELFYKKHDFTEVAALIKTEFKTSKIDSEQINILVTHFKIDYKFYSLIFRLKRPKVVFITQNGIQKGLFAAAGRFNIPVIEVQHGIIDEGHLSYNYSREIDYNSSQVYLPSYFFTFSNFWAKDLYYPVKEIKVMGNTFFSSALIKVPDKNTEKGLLVASSDVFGNNLKDLVIDFSRHNKIPVYFKLHPNQIFEKDYYIEQFKDFSNVKVYTNDKTIYELLKMSKAVLVIQSTAIYEALHSKKMGIILKRQTYRRHEHLFGQPNIYLIDNSKDLSKVLENNYVEAASPDFTFFDDFNKDGFSAFMNRLLANS
jgi:hypothetical protein